MKKIALLLVAFIFMFSLSAVFATEEEPVITTEAPAVEISGEVEDVETTAAEIISGEDDETVEEIENISGEEVAESTSDEEAIDTAETTSDEEATDTADTNESNTPSSNNGSIVGAIIAVVIVVAVVAIAAILRKD